MRHDTAVSDYPPAATGQAPGAGTDTDPGAELIRALHREHAAPLLRFVLHLVGGDRQRADDVVEETLLRAWRNIHRLDGRQGSLCPWLVAVARRIVLPGPRSGLPKPREADDTGLESVPAEEELAKALRLMAMADAMDALTPPIARCWPRPASRAGP